MSEQKKEHLIVANIGNNYSARFLRSWTEFLARCINDKVQVTLMQRAGIANVHHARELLVSGDIFATKDKKVVPFGGREYDYVLWIDSDQIFSYDDYLRLKSHDLDVVSAAIRIAHEDDMFNCGMFDTKCLLKDGKIHAKLCEESVKDKVDPIEVGFVGFGFVLMKYGVFEKMEFPYFVSEKYEIPNLIGYTGEDTGWCTRAKKAGIKLYMDPLCRVLHEKVVAI